MVRDVKLRTHYLILQLVLLFLVQQVKTLSYGASEVNLAGAKSEFRIGNAFLSLPDSNCPNVS